MNGKRSRDLVWTTLGLAAAAGAVLVTFHEDAEGQGAGAPSSITLTGIVRDFRERTVDGGHPDFERRPSSGFGLYIGNVADALDDDGKPVFNGLGRKISSQWRDAQGRGILQSFYDAAQGDSQGSAGVADPGGIDSEEGFAQWFRDVPGVNLSAPLPITLQLDPASGKYVFDDRYDENFSHLGGFFPINGQLLGNSHGDNRNFHFTFELDTEFVYNAGEGDTFTFRGDDDVWVFIGGQRVIDIGGVHGAVDQTVHLDRLGLTDGQTYALKFFFAERHRTQSNFRMETTFPLQTGKLPTVSAMYD